MVGFVVSALMSFLGMILFGLICFFQCNSLFGLISESRFDRS